MVSNQENTQGINSFRLHSTDTGSVEVQIAQLSQRITQLTEHCKQNSKDFASRRGLLKLVNSRRCFLRYIKDKNENLYKNFIERLGLRK